MKWLWKPKEIQCIESKSGNLTGSLSIKLYIEGHYWPHYTRFQAAPWPGESCLNTTASGWICCLQIFFTATVIWRFYAAQPSVAYNETIHPPLVNPIHWNRKEKEKWKHMKTCPSVGCCMGNFNCFLCKYRY